MTIAHPTGRRIAVLAAMLTLLGVAAPAAAGIPPDLRTPGTLSVCSYRHFTPIAYGDGEGYEADLLRAVAAAWGVPIAFTPIEAYDGIWLTPSDPALGCDVAMGGITPTDARIAAGAVFSPVTARFAQTLLVRRADVESGRIAGYASFPGTEMVIGVVPGTTGAEYARLRAAEAGLPEGAIREYPGEDELLAALVAGEIDALARGEIGNRYQETLDPSLVTIDPRDFGEGMAFSVDPANPDLLAALGATLALVTADGTVGYTDWLADPGIFLATAGVPAEPVREAGWTTDGTAVRVHNFTGKRLYYRLYHPVYVEWRGPYSLEVNDSVYLAYDWPTFDDVELHLFFSEAAAKANEKPIDIQAENPAWSAPWVSINGWTEYFQSEGESHEIVERCRLRDGDRFWVKREGDTSGYKELTIHLKQLDLEWRKSCNPGPS